MSPSPSCPPRHATPSSASSASNSPQPPADAAGHWREGQDAGRLASGGPWMARREPLEDELFDDVFGVGNAAGLIAAAGPVGHGDEIVGHGRLDHMEGEFGPQKVLPHGQLGPDRRGP